MKRVILKIAKPLVWLLFPFKVIGKENIPAAGKKFVLCSNHISLVDPVFLLETFPQHLYFMAKAELFRNKFIGWVLRRFGAFPVDRGSGDYSAIHTAQQLVQEGKVLGIFPEGTRSKTGELLRLKSGAVLIAATTGADVLPVCVVAKDQKIRLFRRTKIVYGKTLTLQQLHLDGEKPELRYACRQLTASLQQLLEENK